jgi:hypothetical protein
VSLPRIALQITADELQSLTVGFIWWSSALPTAGAGDDDFLCDCNASTMEPNHIGISKFTRWDYPNAHSHGPAD